MPPGSIRSASGYFVIVALVVLAVWVQGRLELLPFIEPQLEALTDFQTQQVDVYLASVEALANIATLTFAAVGALLFNGRRGRVSLHRQWPLALSGVCAAGSLYFAWVAYQQLLWMLALEFFNFDNPRIWWVTRLQFGCVAASAGFLFYFVLTEILNE